MSVETWSPAVERFVRFPLCGHSEKLKNVHQIMSGSLECPTCGGVQAEDFANDAPFDCVPSQLLTWDGASRRDNRVLGAFRSDKQQLSTLENALALLSSTLSHADLSGRELRPHHVPRRQDSFSVWRAHTHGNRVTAGSVGLPPGGTLLLTGQGATFSGTTFKASGNAATSMAIVCAGEDFVATFEDCRFEQCAVHVVHGAAVTLRRCVLRRCNPGFVASGPATSAILQHCLFDACPMACIVEAGAAVRAVACAMHRSDTGAYVNDAGSHAAFHDCVMHGHHQSSYAVVVHGGRADVTRCKVEVWRVGVQTWGKGPRAEVHGSVFDNCCVAVVLVPTSHAAVRNVKTDNKYASSPITMKDPPAVLLSGTDAMTCGARAQLERCSLQSQKGGSIGVTGGSHAELVLCVLRSNTTTLTAANMSRVTLLRCDARSKGVACRVGGRGCMLRAGHCTLTGADSACAVSVEAAATLVDTELRGIRSAATEGVITVTDARALLVRCAVRDSVTGVRVVGGHLAARDTLIAGTFPRVKDVTDDTAPPNPGAAYSCPRGTLTVTGGAVKGCGVGVWLGAVHWETGRPSGACRAHVGGVVFEGYGSAFQVMSGSTVEIDGCEFWGRDCQDAGERAVQPRGPNGERDFTAQAVLRFTSGQGAVRGCRFEGNTCDIDGDVRGVLRVACCEFKNRYVPERGGLLPPTDAMSSPCVSVGGNILLEDCTFSNVKGGVACRGDDCTIRRCTFTHVCGGVMVMDGDRLKMLDCKFENGTQACLIGHGGTVAVQDCVCDGFKAGFIVARGGGGAVTAKRVTVRGGKRAVMVLSDPGPVTDVKLVECVMQGQDEGVWLAGAGVRASLLNCELSGSDVGLQVNSSVTARMRKSRVADCETGIRVGEDLRNMMSPCRACGVDSRSQRAVEAAFKALGRSAQRSTPGHCPHQGGVGQLTVGDVVVRKCSWGLYISTHGRVDVVDMHVEACSHSVLQRYHGQQEPCTFSGCTLAACDNAPVQMHELVSGFADDWSPLAGFAQVPARGDSSHA